LPGEPAAALRNSKPAVVGRVPASQSARTHRGPQHYRKVCCSVPIPSSVPLDYNYLIENPTRGWYKIGFTSEKAPERRFRAIMEKWRTQGDEALLAGAA
jgi:hypothetical protein